MIHAALWLLSLGFFLFLGYAVLMWFATELGEDLERRRQRRELRRQQRQQRRTGGSRP